MPLLLDIRLRIHNNDLFVCVTEITTVIGMLCILSFQIRVGTCRWLIWRKYEPIE